MLHLYLYYKDDSKLFPKLTVPVYISTSLVDQMVKNLPALQETRVQSLSQGDPLEKAMATHSSVLAWKIPWTK